MSQRSILFFALAIVLALGAVWAARSWLEGRTPGAPAATVVTVPVVVAGVDVPVGSFLVDRQVSSVDWPKRYVPDGAFSDEKQLDKRVTRRPLAAGEVILESSLLPQGSEAGLVSVISDAKRAVSVKVDSVIGVAGFVTPGSHVDVLATLRRIDTNGLPYSKVILQDVRVLAVDQRMEKTGDGEPEVVSVVTLEVEPKTAEKLIYSAHEGRLQLALRNPGDRKKVETRSVTVTDLLGKRRPRSNGRARRRSVQLLKGTKISTKWF